MEGDGLNSLLEIMHKNSKATQRPTVFVGVVRSVSPLTVEAAGVTLAAADLLVNARVLQSNANADEADRLTAGCKVALVSGDLDTFIVLCKVVKP